MKISFGIGQLSEERLLYAKQLGADGVTCTATVIPGYTEKRVVTVDEMANLKKHIESYGLELLTFRFRPQDTYNVLCNPTDRDREIDNVCATIHAAGQVDVPFVYYNLTPWRSLDASWSQIPSLPALKDNDLGHGSGPGRYHLAVGRGNADLLTHTSTRANEDIQNVPASENAPYGFISADELWDRVQYFYDRVIPTAEEAGVNVGAHIPTIHPSLSTAAPNRSTTPWTASNASSISCPQIAVASSFVSAPSMKWATTPWPPSNTSLSTTKSSRSTSAIPRAQSPMVTIKKTSLTKATSTCTT